MVKTYEGNDCTSSAAQRSLVHVQRIAGFLNSLDPLQRAYVLGGTSDPALQSEFFTVSLHRVR